MPLFKQDNQSLKILRPASFPREKDLQGLIETNLPTLFGGRVVEGEFYTGAEHSGRIDTLALSDDNSPVIIEYKNVESDGVVNQALFYLAWLLDHKGDFQEAVRKNLGSVTVDWSSVRVLCIAPSYSRYTLYAVQQMSVRAQLELWQFQAYEDGVFQLEKVWPEPKKAGPKPVKAVTEFSGNSELPVYEVTSHRQSLETTEMQHAFDELIEYVLGLGDSVEVIPRKQYVSFKLSRNFGSVETQKKKMIVLLYVDIDQIPESFPLPYRDVSNIGTWGSGNVEIQIHSPDQVAAAAELVKLAFDTAGGN